MSLLTAAILQKLEAELLEKEPEISLFIIKQLHILSTEVVNWAEDKMKAMQEAHNTPA